MSARLQPVAGAPGPVRPELHLSGGKLRGALERLLTGCESAGGIEHYIDALKLKSRMFHDALVTGRPETIDLDTFAGLCAFMATVRRRIAPYLDAAGLARLRAALTALLAPGAAPPAADARMAAFVRAFPTDAAHRWVRDLAAEVLHNVDPERYPLMARWVWDAEANTGVLREIWFADDIDHVTLTVADDFTTFVVLREELAVFLTDNGFYRDMSYYVDLLLAQIYAEYIAAQGGSWLRTDFSVPADAMQHTRRMLGLDGVRAGSARTRLKAIDGTAYVLGELDT
jgi:hypothetical protein